MRAKDKQAPQSASDPFSEAVDKGAIDIVGSLSEMFNKSFGPKSNVICLPRKLQGDFNGVAAFFHREFSGESRSLNEEEFSILTSALTGELDTAADCIMEDFKAMRESGCKTVVLRVVNDAGYNNEDETGSEDVHLFHADGGCLKRGRVLTCYTVATSEGIASGDAACLRDLENFDIYGEKLYNQQDSFSGPLDRYLDFLYAQREGYFIPLQGKKPFSFGLGDIWRQAVQDNKDGVEAFIHRAPRTPKGSLPRLLMVGDYAPLVVG